VRKIGLAGAALFLLLAGVVVFRTLSVGASDGPGVSVGPVAVDVDRLTANLGTAITFRTISYQPPRPYNPEPFEAFIAWLAQAYPGVHETLALERIGKHALLYTWQGTDPAAKPVLLTGHYDVVPVIPGTEKKWQHPPFQGVRADGYVWGRGALDDKGGVIAILEAATILINEGFQPRQTVYLAFGHDEEVGGARGARAIAQTLAARNVQLAWSLDEGSAVLSGVVPGIEKPVASINVAEKGYVTIALVARAEGGHSSAPPARTAVTELAEAIVKISDNPFPAHLDGPSAELLRQLAPEMPFIQRMAIANQWLLGGFVKSGLLSSPATAATIRTTIAPTMLSASTNENVLPIEARAVVNFRLHPRETVDEVLAHVRRAIENDAIEIEVLTADPASRVSSTDSTGYELLRKATLAHYPDAIVAPGMTIGGTDSKHYGQIADNAYRFNPVVMTPEIIKTFHGTNERVSVESLAKMTGFFVTLLRESNAVDAPE